MASSNFGPRGALTPQVRSLLQGVLERLPDPEFARLREGLFEGRSSQVGQFSRVATLDELERQQRLPELAKLLGVEVEGSSPALQTELLRAPLGALAHALRGSVRSGALDPRAIEDVRATLASLPLPVLGSLAESARNTVLWAPSSRELAEVLTGQLEAAGWSALAGAMLASLGDEMNLGLRPTQVQELVAPIVARERQVLERIRSTGVYESSAPPPEVVSALTAELERTPRYHWDELAERVCGQSFDSVAVSMPDFLMVVSAQGRWSLLLEAVWGMVEARAAAPDAFELPRARALVAELVAFDQRRLEALLHPEVPAPAPPIDAVVELEAALSRLEPSAFAAFAERVTQVPFQDSGDARQNAHALVSTARAQGRAPRMAEALDQLR